MKIDHYHLIKWHGISNFNLTFLSFYIFYSRKTEYSSKILARPEYFRLLSISARLQFKKFWHFFPLYQYGAIWNFQIKQNHLVISLVFFFQMELPFLLEHNLVEMIMLKIMFNSLIMINKLSFLICKINK